MMILSSATANEERRDLIDLSNLLGSLQESGTSFNLTKEDFEGFDLGSIFEGGPNPFDELTEELGEFVEDVEVVIPVEPTPAEEPEGPKYTRPEEEEEQYDFSYPLADWADKNLDGRIDIPEWMDGNQDSLITLPEFPTFESGDAPVMEDAPEEEPETPATHEVMEFDDWFSEEFSNE